MVDDVLAATAASIVVFIGTLGLLGALFRLQVRSYNRAVATDLLDDWTARLELVDPAERERLAPPSDVVAAMVGLPGPGLRDAWDGLPARSLDG